MAKIGDNEIDISIDGNNIIHVNYINIPRDLEVSFKLLEMFDSEVNNLIKQSGKKSVNMVVDTRMPKKFYRYFTSKERKKTVEIAKIKELGYIAIVGNDLIMKVSTSFISKALGKELKWFNDEKKAYEWLLSKQEK